MNEAPPAIPVKVPLFDDAPGILKTVARARDNLLSIIPARALEAPIVSGTTGDRWHMIMEPAAIRQVLISRLDDYPKSVVTKSLLNPAIGESLFVAEGEHWRWQRRAAAPAFAHRAIRGLTPVMSRAAAQSCERIAAAGPRAVNLAEEMTATTLDVIADVTFSADDPLDRTAVHRAIDGYITEAGRLSLFDLLGVPDWLPRPGRRKHIARIEKTKADADRAIDRRQARGPQETPDLLDHLLAAQDPQTGRAMTTTELRDNLLTFIVAGHETTAQTLAWAFYLLGFDPSVQEALRAEAQAALQGRVATAEDLEALPLTRQVIEETLRLYPAGGLLSRTALKRDTLCGTDIFPGDTVMIPIYALGRHRALWEEPDAFRPERFADRSGIDRFAYLPFGDGPRVCIGASFAIQEAVIILATLVSRFRFAPVPGRTPAPKMIITLRPEGGVWMTATPV